MTGDGAADFILVQDTGLYLYPSTGSSFAPGQNWTEYGAYGTFGHFFADVDGDGRKDFIAALTTKTTVRLSTGTSFATPQDWSPSTLAQGWGNLGTDYVDVNGDGKADAVISAMGKYGNGGPDFGAPGVFVSLSNGQQFEPLKKWFNDGLFRSAEALCGASVERDVRQRFGKAFMMSGELRRKVARSLICSRTLPGPNDFALGGPRACTRNNVART